jgi:hypothetical protein
VSKDHRVKLDHKDHRVKLDHKDHRVKLDHKDHRVSKDLKAIKEIPANLHNLQQELRP